MNNGFMKGHNFANLGTISNVRIFKPKHWSLSAYNYAFMHENWTVKIDFFNFDWINFKYFDKKNTSYYSGIHLCHLKCNN